MSTPSIRPTLTLVILVSLLPAGGCRRDLGPPPAIDRVEPTLARNDLAIVLHVFGQNFLPRPWLDLDQPSSSTLSESFAMELLSPERTVALGGVLRASDTELTGTIPPLTPPGTYAVRVTDPWERSTLLDAAFTLTAECQQAEDCDDGLACTQDACVAYRCTHALPADDGTSCDDGYACTGPDACIAGACRGPPLCGNTPPLACLTVSPTAGPAGTTVTLDARCSFDLEDPTSALQFQFFSSGDLPVGPPGAAASATFTYTDAGLHEASVAVWDTGGLVGVAARYVSIAGPGEDVVVTTPADESDPGATPAEPGGTGLSLREAIAYANDAGVPKAIRFLSPMTVRANELPALTAAASRIAGMPGVVLDFSPATATLGRCLSLSGTDQVLLGVEALACPEVLLLLQGSNNQVAECRLHDGRGQVIGVQASGRNARVGPRTDVFGFGDIGVQLRGDDQRVDGSRIYGNGLGIDLKSASAVTVHRSAIFGNTGGGISISPSVRQALLQHNTVDRNGGSGVEFSAPSPTTSTTVVNSLFTANGGAGLCGTAANYIDRRFNGYFANDGGSYCQGSPDAGVTADPLYLSSFRNDYRLSPGSPAANAGTDAGVDLNGPLPGSFHGSAPDLGAHESF